MWSTNPHKHTVKTSDSLGNHLNALLQDAENRVYDLSGGSGGSGNGAQGNGVGVGSGASADDPNTMQLPVFNNRASFSSIIGEYIENVFQDSGVFGVQHILFTKITMTFSTKINLSGKVVYILKK